MGEPAQFSYVDDPTIGDGAPLWRRIPPCHFVFDQNLGRYRPSTAAFEDHPNGTPMSVILGQELIDSGRAVNSALADHKEFALASFAAGFARAHGLGIVRRPLTKEPAHAEVFGRKTQSVKKALARTCEWIIQPTTAS
jgi:hypothetical protein